MDRSILTQEILDYSNSFREMLTIAPLQRRYCNTRKCVTSKASLLVLLWSFLVSLQFFFLYYLFFFVQSEYHKHLSVFLLFLFLLYPIAGHLADTKFGRYKVVVLSLWTLSFAAILEVVAVIVLGLALTGIGSTTTHREHKHLINVGVSMGIFVLCLLALGTTGFFANIIQFGLDQLHDSPAEDQTVFIHWYMWAYYISQLIMRTVLSSFRQSLNTYYLGYVTLELILVCSAIALISSLGLARSNRHWFLIQPRQVTPYRLVCLVTKFSCKHKVPVNRSAFTYCEDEIPSGLDLGKAKYGGPFTTEQVEDVKVFYGILKVLFSLCPIFFMNQIAAMMSEKLIHFPNNTINVTMHKFLQTSGIVEDFDYVSYVEELLIHDKALYYFSASVGIPFYLFVIRPIGLNYIPRMLKRIGIAHFIVLIFLILTTIKGFFDSELHCSSWHYHIRNVTTSPTPKVLHLSSYLSMSSEVATAISHVTLYVALYEFINSQSPSSMKGLLIGLTYSAKGFFELIAVFIKFLLTFTNCRIDIYIYVANIGIGMVSLLVYICISKKYKSRVRDDICNIHHFAEEYYSKTREP